MKEWKIKRWMEPDGRQKRGMVRDNANEDKLEWREKEFTGSNERRRW